MEDIIPTLLETEVGKIVRSLKPKTQRRKIGRVGQEVGNKVEKGGHGV